MTHFAALTRFRFPTRVIACLCALLMSLTACVTPYERTRPMVGGEPVQPPSAFESVLEFSGRILAWTAVLVLLTAVEYARLEAGGARIYYDNR